MISVVIPNRAIDSCRELNITKMVMFYRSHFPDAEIIVADDPNPHDFNRGNALNEGVRRSRGDILILADSDLYVHPSHLYEAVRKASVGLNVVVPFNRVYYCKEGVDFDLSHIELWSSSPKPFANALACYMAQSHGGINVLSRDTFRYLGGFDPGFVGWGCEDAAFYTASVAFGVPWSWINTAAIHRYHPSATKDGPGSEGVKVSAALYTAVYNKEMTEEHKQSVINHVRLNRSHFGIAPGYFHRTLDGVSAYNDMGMKDEWQKEVYKKFASVLVRENVEGIKVGDIGCGSGFKTSKYLPIGTTGYELPEFLGELRATIPHGRWSSVACYDRVPHSHILCSDVIEHLQHPDQFMNQLRCNPHLEYLGISTPCRQTLYEIGARTDTLGPPWNNTHYREWTKDEFSDFVASFGFEVEEALIVDRSQATCYIGARRI